MGRTMDVELKPPFNFTTEDLYWLCNDLYDSDWEKFLSDLEEKLKAPSKVGMDKIFDRIRRDISIIKSIIKSEGKTLSKQRLKEALARKAGK